MLTSLALSMALFVGEPPRLPLPGPAPAEPTAAPEVTLESLLAEMVDRSAIARFPSPAFTCAQFSSYDPASTSPENPETWWANGDAGHYLRVEERDGRQEHVMVDAKGPGALVRIWSANPKGVLRIYIDGSSTPVIEGSMTDLLGGVAVGKPLSEESSRGWNLFLPIPYAERCIVTSDSGGFYYQVNYRTYEPGAGVRSLTRESLAAGAPAIARVNERLRAIEPATMRAPAWITIAPGASLRLDLAGRTRVSKALTELVVNLEAADREAALRSTVLTGTFDGEETIWCPLGDFFGSGVGLNPYRDWYRAVDASGAMASRWVMPFRSSGVLAIQNFSKEPVRIAAEVKVEEWSWDDRSMHFHARWRAEHPIAALGGRGTSDWNYVTIDGKGVFAGDNLAVMNPVDAWWGEGDEKIYVDGEAFPSHFGTGTEDYYGYAWCCNIPFEHPFHAQPRCDGEAYGNNWGHTTVSRVRALDGIPFHDSFRFDMEIWHWKACEVGYAATTYFYAMPGAQVNRKPDPVAAGAPIVQPPPLPPPFSIPGVLEAESLKVVAKSPDLTVVRQDMRGFAARTWSGEAHLWVQGRKPGDFVELEIPAVEAANHVLSIYLTRSWDYGIVRCSIDGQPVGSDIDLFSGGEGKVQPTGRIRLAMVAPKQADPPAYRLRIEVVGGHEASLGTKSFFGIDAVHLDPTQ